MRRLVLAIDCDDVLVDSTRYIVDRYNDLHGTSVQYQYAHTPGYVAWGQQSELVHRRINDIQLSEEYGAIEPSTMAVKAVHELAKNHELHLITARSGLVERVTRRMLDIHFSDCFSSVEHVGLGRSKGEACSAISADILVDDNAKHLIEAREKSVQNLIWFGDYAWQAEQVSPPGAIRCTDWTQVNEEIDRIARR